MTPPDRDVLVVSQLPPPVHGSTVMTGILMQTLRELGVEPILVDRRFSRRISQVGTFSVGKIVRAVGLELRLIRALASRRPDVAIVFTTTSPWSALADAATTATCVLFRVRIVHYLLARGMNDLAAKGRLWRRIVGSMLGRGELVVSLSDELADDIRAFVEPSRIEIVPNTIDTPPQHHRASQGRTVLFLSNLLPTKGAMDFVQLAADLADEFEDLSFVLAGAHTDSIHSAEVAGRAAALGLGERLRLPGAVSAERLRELFATAELFVFPSRYAYEAQPLVLLEALAAGVPAVAYRIPGIASIIDDGRTGALVEPGDLAGLVSAARNILAHPESRQTLSLACRRRFEVGFGRTRYRDNWARLLTRAGTDRRRTARSRRVAR